MIVYSTSTLQNANLAAGVVLGAAAYPSASYSWRIQFGTTGNNVAGGGIYQVDVQIRDSGGTYRPVIQDRPILAAAGILYHQTNPVYLEDQQFMRVFLTGQAGDISDNVIAICLLENYSSDFNGPCIIETEGVGVGAGGGVGAGCS